MTDIEQKALALVNEVARELGWGEIKEIFAAGYTRNEALFRAIEQHEAFRQEVSDAVELSIDRSGHDGLRAGHINEYLGRFIIPKPKPDRLVEVVHKLGWDKDTAADLRAALDALGFEIREKNDD